MVNRFTQDLDAEAMEGADSGVAFVVSALQEFMYTLLHFARCFVGEGNRQDLFREDAFFDQLSDAVSDDARLSRASARKHEEGAIFVEDRIELVFIEVHGQHAQYYKRVSYKYPYRCVLWERATSRK